ncbi:putative ubiquitin carboxyl-terminal hydrolase 7 [Vanrija pseudolonga]|uniref:ubiquitinyl hydrolase 1 n=1 Tax=Vanrija pseudolonga TaxID=143232 RepID=A0AAF0YIR1_9TREE|nr:putative ubiquitin carboxyl-terminal hydrolase 7 [Vanrija pseudolonga]
MLQLSATPQLIALLSANPAWSLTPSANSILPPPPRAPQLTPSLLPAASEMPLYPLLPVTRAFNDALGRAWATKDVAGPSISIKGLLKELARKYDQYDEFAQQDAHELLRHLLDSMEMEERDIIKRVQPPRPAPTGSSPDGGASLSASIASLPLPAAPDNGIPDSERLLPFVDVLFGGLLASIVVCETCKSVSHTYEGFLDLSLSLRGDDDTPRLRKRDRFRSITSKFKPRTVSSKLAGEPTATMSDPEGDGGERRERKSKQQHLTVNSETENEHGAAGLGRSASTSKSFGGLKGRTSFSFRRKGGRSVSGTTEKENGAASDTSAASASTAQPSEPALILEPVAEGESAVPMSSSSPAEQPHAQHHQHHHHQHQAGPTPAQAAYIQRILYGPPGAPESHDPIAKLRAAHAGELGVGGGGKPDSGLVDSLKAFTSVEVLEGDNAFACRKCWKIKNGYYRDKKGARNWRRERKHHDGHKSETDHHTEVLVSPASSTSVLSPSPSSGLLSPSPIKRSAPLPILQADDDRLGRSPSLAARSPAMVRAPSPLRQRIEKDEDSEHIPISRFDTTKSSETTVSLSSLNTTSSADTQTSSTKTAPTTLDTIPIIDVGAEADGEDGECDSDSDGLSNTDTEDETMPASLPKPSPSRGGGFFHSRKDPAKDKNFILRRAFKRYLIARAPETLVFHLKRFKQTGKAGMYSNFSTLKKMDDFVSFPEMLDLAPFFAPNRSDFKLTRTSAGVHAPFMDWPSPEKGPELSPVWYKLYAIVVHMGTMVGGHYIAYVLVDPERMFADPRHPDKVSDITAAADRLSDMKLGDAKIRGRDRRVWCYCSDTEVRFASVDEVLNARAYLCFYEKVQGEGRVGASQ